jgi:integrase
MSRVFERKKGEWWIDFKDAQGKRRRIKIAPNKRIAKEALDNYLGKVARRVHLGVVDDSEIGFGDFMKIWWERIGPDLAISTRERWTRIVEGTLKPFFAGTQLRAVNAAKLMDFIATRRDAGAKPGTINLEASLVKNALKRAVAWEFLSVNPLMDRTGDCVVKPLKAPPARCRYASPDEVNRLLSACVGDRYLHAFVVVALNSGMRRSEILLLSRNSIDWTHGTATLAVTKNGESAHVALNAAAMEALRGLPTPLYETGRLFPFEPRQMTMRFSRAARVAGVQNFRLHDTRHTFASYHAMAGTPTRGLQELLRHKSASMTARYSHLSPGYLRQQVERVSFGQSAENSGTYLAPDLGISQKV